MNWRASLVHGIARALRVRNEAPAFDAAATGRRLRGWNPGSRSPNDMLGSVTLLRERARAGARNDGVAAAIVTRLVSNLVGTGLRPLSQAPDRAFQAAVQRAWARWTLESDPERLLSFYGQTALTTRAWLEGGEVFVRLRPRLASDGLSVPLQLQIIEPELCPVSHNATSGGDRIRAGIEFSPIGQRAGYWMYRQRPGDLQDMDVSQLVRVPAAGVLHIYDVVRPGQIRGLPHLTRALIRLYELDQYDDATLVRVKLANMFAGFVTTPAGTNSAGETTDPITGGVLVRDASGRGEIALEPGTFSGLAPGEDVTFNDPPDAGATYEPFMAQQLRAAAIAADVPYEVLTGDMRAVNDRTVRVILNEFRRRLEQVQAQLLVDRFCRPVFEAWFDAAFIAGVLTPPAAYLDDPEPWRRVRWQGQRHEYLQPVQDVEAQRDEVRVGLTSLSAQIIERGEDPDDVFAAIAADNARLDALGIRVDSDGRRPLSGKGAGGEEPTPPSATAA